MWKGVLVFVLGLVSGLYTTFVLTILWNWFVVPAFHLSEISFWMTYGLVLVFNLFRDPGERTLADEQEQEALTTMLEACVPQDRKEYVKEQLESQAKSIWKLMGVSLFSQMVGNTIALGIGFVVHVFAA
jgi:hypothetical protein